MFIFGTKLTKIQKRLWVVRLGIKHKKVVHVVPAFYANRRDCFSACGATRMGMNETRMDMNIFACGATRMGRNETRMDMNNIYEHSWVIHENSC